MTLLRSESDAAMLIEACLTLKLCIIIITLADNLSSEKRVNYLILHL